MGRDKATLPLASGERLVDRVAAAVAAALRGAGEAAPRVLVSGEVPGHPCVPDAAAGLGPLGGLASVIGWVAGADEGLPAEHAGGPLGIRPEGTPPGWILVVPVDLPALSPAPLAALLAAPREGAAALAFEGHALPALLRLDARVRAAVAARAAANGRERAVWRLLDDLEARRIPLDAALARELVNVNTPEELEVALGPVEEAT
jgi:molybdopterin-guanine dinucleotide biosynthesis protein A